MTNGIFSSAVAGTPAVEASGTNAAEGISASSDTGAGVSGTSASGNGGMFGSWGGAAAAAAAWTPAGNGVLGVVGPGAPPDLPVGGVVGVNQAPALTIPNQGPLPGGPGVFGTSISGSGVVGTTGSGLPAVNGSNTGGGSGVAGSSVSGNGVTGTTGDPNNSGVWGNNTGTGFGVAGSCASGGTAVYGNNPTGVGSGAAGLFNGNVQVDGYLQVNGDQGVFGTLKVFVDVELIGADCAEEFDVSDAAEIEPGTVMVLDQHGALQSSRQAYDKRVAGVISGAGDYKPGMILDRKESSEGRVPLALVGKVFCKVDAQYVAIEVGDLLTTSSTPGHAMKVADPFKAFGTVIGKALRPLQSGQGMIPILVALQ